MQQIPFIIKEIQFSHFVDAEKYPGGRMEQTRDKRAINERNTLTPRHDVERRRSAAVHRTNNACCIRTPLARVRSFRRIPHCKPDRPRTERQPLRFETGHAAHAGFLRHTRKRRQSPFSAVNLFFSLDRTAAFMYISRVLLGRSNVSCRAVERPSPPLVHHA
jgi:hypothetical protein